MEFVKSIPGADPIIVSAYVAAAPTEVFRAWTDPHVVQRWFGPAPGALVAATVDLRIGGQWCFVEHQSGAASSGFSGQYVVVEPPERLVFTWEKFATDANGVRTSTAPSRVEIRLAQNGVGTDLHITHSGIVGHEMRRGFAGGWNRGIAGLLLIIAQRGEL